MCEKIDGFEICGNRLKFGSV